MKKSRTFFLIMILILLTAALSACGLFGAGGGKVELTEEMVKCPYLDNIYVYSGEPITFGADDLHIWVDGNAVSIDLFDIEYEDNVEAGTASVIVTAKPDNDLVKGSVTLHFTIIENGSVDCVSTDDLAALLAKPSVGGVMMWSDYTIPEGVTVTVPAGKRLNLVYGYRLWNYGTIVNNGSVVIRGAQLTTGARRATELLNCGVLENHGSLSVKEYGIVNDLGAFTSDGVVENVGTIYLKDAAKDFVADGEGGATYVRIPVTADAFAVEECVYTQGCHDYKPHVSPKAYGAEFTVEYADNHHAGTAAATVDMDERDAHYYGSVTIPFEIKKGQASASNAEQLGEFVASGDYEGYTISSLEIPSGETFTLPAGESLRVSGSLTVGGTMNAEGNVAVNNNLTISEGATLVNEGNFTVSGVKFVVNGTFRNGAKGDWSFGAKSVDVAGTFVNQGVVENKSFALSREGTLRNEGTLSLSFNGYHTGAFENVGKATFVGANNYAPAFSNERGGEVTLTGDVRFSSEFMNAGAVVNTGRVVVQENCTYACSGTFDNSEGEVWAYRDLAGVTENCHKKKKLTDDGVVFRASYAETYYNTRDQKPSFTVDGEPLPKGEYSLTFYSVSQEKNVKECIKPDEFKMYVYVNTDYSEYAGRYEYTYSILPATIRVSDSSGYYAASRDDGYDKIVLDDDVALSVSSGVGSNCVLDLNGHRIVVRDFFTVRGTIVGGAAVDPESFVPDEEAACLVVEKDGYLYNYGRIVNDGFLFVKGGGNFYPNAHATGNDPLGTVVNNGVIFTPSAVTVESGAGKVCHRKNLTDVKSLVRVPTVPYDGTPQTPAPTMNYNGSDVDVSRFSLRYALNVEAGTALLRLDVVDPVDPDFYGTASVPFTIVRGTATVGNESELTAAGADPNYAVIRLISEVRVVTTIPLSDDQILDIGAYDVSGAGKVVFGKNCKLVLTAGDQTRFVKYFYGADEITLTGDIGVAGTQTELTFKTYAIGNYQNVNYLSTTVHLDGYSFLGGLSIANSSIEDFACVFENSSETVSMIGSGVTGNEGGYALTYGTCYEETYVTLRNLTVYGVNHHGGSGTNQVADLSAEGCTFLAARDRQDAYALRLWTSMTGSGTFRNCTFDGANAFYVNRGYEYDHDAGKTLPAYFFYSCTLNAYGTPDKKEFYGNALTMDRNTGNLYVSVSASHFYSENGNCIRITNSTGVSLDLDDRTTFEHPEGKSNVSR